MYKLSLVLLAIMAAYTVSPAGFADDANERTITGAGAHFSWVVFAAQRKSLEKLVNRPIRLFGREQMLGAGCNAGIKMAQASRPGRESFGLVCCELTGREIREKLLKVFPIAKEPLLILVNESNPVSNLSVGQVRDIFSGKITNWKQVGGKDQPVVVVLRPHCKHRPDHWKTILPSMGQFREDRVNVRSAHEMMTRITDFSGAIGHTGTAWDFAKGQKVKPITVSGFAATAENLKKGKYPFYRTLSAVTNKTPSEDIINLIDYARSSGEFQQVTRQYELLPLVDRQQ